MMDGVFLHTGWRSGGTWLWQKLREHPGHAGFYEPLHEFLPGMGRRALGEISPQSWKSRHGASTSPYFTEYAPLLHGTGKGVQFALPRFAFSRFFLGPQAQDEPLAAYIGHLVAQARAQGLNPVFKCTRTQGRLPWFRAQFPQLRHAALIRQPWTQFRSAWRCFAQDGNKYFLAAPFLVLERNPEHSDVAALAQHLSLPLGWGRHLPLGLRLKSWKLAARLLDAGTLYKAHLALWLLNALAVYEADVPVLDGDAPPAQLAGNFGVAAGRMAPPPFTPPPFWPSLSPEELHHIHETALAILSPRLSPALVLRLQGWLTAAAAAAARDLHSAARCTTVAAA